MNDIEGGLGTLEVGVIIVRRFVVVVLVLVLVFVFVLISVVMGLVLVVLERFEALRMGLMSVTTPVIGRIEDTGDETDLSEIDFGFALLINSTGVAGKLDPKRSSVISKVPSCM